MLDRYIVPWQERVLRRPAQLLARSGVTANAVTISGFVIGLLALPAIALRYYWLGLAFVIANRILDGVDGALARAVGPTSRGAYLDIALDFFFYATIPFAFGLADPAANALAASALLLAFVGTGSSFLAFAVIAEKLRMTSTNMPKKGIFYLGGITEGAETIGFFISFCIWPKAFAVLSIVFSLLALATTVTRWWWGWQAFGTAASCLREEQHGNLTEAKAAEAIVQ